MAEKGKKRKNRGNFQNTAVDKGGKECYNKRTLKWGRKGFDGGCEAR